MEREQLFEAVQERLKGMGLGTAEQVHAALQPLPYSLIEVQKQLDRAVAEEPESFAKTLINGVYRYESKKRYRVGMGP